eukprot:15091-Karenia_brevis.AAC.1
MGCPFGCGGESEDSWMHLRRCIPLWLCVKEHIQSFVLSPDVDVLLGLHNAAPDQLLGVVLAFHIYHGCRDFVSVGGETLMKIGKANYTHFMYPFQ